MQLIGSYFASDQYSVKVTLSKREVHSFKQTPRSCADMHTFILLLLHQLTVIGSSRKYVYQWFTRPIYMTAQYEILNKPLTVVLQSHLTLSGQAEMKNLAEDSTKWRHAERNQQYCKWPKWDKQPPSPISLQCTLSVRPGKTVHWDHFNGQSTNETNMNTTCS